MRRARTGRVVPAAVVLMALVAGGCGGGDAGPGTAPAEPRDVREPGDRRDRPTPLGRHDAPPDGVARQISFAAIGDDLCAGGPETPGISYGRLPLVVYEHGEQPPPEDEMEVGRVVEICVRHVAPELPIELKLDGPEGFHRELTIPPDDYPSVARRWVLAIERMTPRGTYAVEARAGGLRLMSTFEVVDARLPAVRFAGRSKAFEAGETIEAFVVGFEPGESAVVDVYRYDDAGDLTYATTISTQVEADGIGPLAIPTSRRDPRTSYVLRPRMDGPPTQMHDGYLTLE